MAAARVAWFCIAHGFAKIAWELQSARRETCVLRPVSGSYRGTKPGPSHLLPVVTARGAVLHASIHLGVLRQPSCTDTPLAAREFYLFMVATVTTRLCEMDRVAGATPQRFASYDRTARFTPARRTKFCGTERALLLAYPGRRSADSFVSWAAFRVHSRWQACVRCRLHLSCLASVCIFFFLDAYHIEIK
jgi:hypothetical protein